MRLLILLALLITLSACQPATLPTLLQLTNHTFSTTYDCQGSYETSALFLSESSQAINGPELVIRGTCGELPTISTATAGNDLGFATDIGAVPLNTLNCQDAFLLATLYTENSSRNSVRLIEGHTYLVANSFSNERTYWGFTANSVSQSPTGGAQASITYTIYLFEIYQGTASPNFSWANLPGSG